MSASGLADGLRLAPPSDPKDLLLLLRVERRPGEALPRVRRGDGDARLRGGGDREDLVEMEETDSTDRDLERRCFDWRAVDCSPLSSSRLCARSASFFANSSSATPFLQGIQVST